MAAWVKVRDRGPGLLRPRLYVGTVCHDSAAVGGICANTALHRRTIASHLIMKPYQLLRLCCDPKEGFFSCTSERTPSKTRLLDKHFGVIRLRRSCSYVYL